MATIKITQLPSIGNALTTSTILPVVDVTGTATTGKVTVGSIANFALMQAGDLLPPAFVSQISYSVANAAQPNITSVGNLTGLTITNVNNFHIPGGTNGYVLQTDGAGNLSWAAQSGGGGNSNPGGADTQVQFNDAGEFGGNVEFTFNKTSGIFTAPFLAGNGNGLSNIQSANVVGIGNVATLSLSGSNSNVLYGNGVFAPISGIVSSELVNGDNSFALQSDGNVVFSGSEGGVNRGLVWDYGAVANGVNSEVRQDINGLSVRAWTEAGGPGALYAAPVNIVTNQDANAKTWTFDGQGNLTVPPGNINAINDGGQLGAQVLLQPDLGKARLAARTLEYTENFNSGGWTSASYTGTQVDIIDAPNLLGFVSNNTIFTSAVDRTFSINGGEPVPYQGYGASGNNVTLYTSITADPDPTVVTSIDFYYQSESYFGIDYDDGGLDIIATGLTINIDNDQTSGPDINLRSGDDITLQAKDKALGSESEGGDINILAGDGADDDGQGNTASTGGDIQITAGNGGDGNSSTGSSGGFTQIYGGTGGTAGVTSTAGSGGYVSINGGDGGYDTGNTQLGAGGGYVSINAGMSTQEGVNGPNVTITSGQGGPNALAGSVVISTPASANGPGGNWTFDGDGNLTLPGGGSVYSEGFTPSGNPGNTITLNPHGSGSITNQKLMVYPTAGDGDHIHMTSGNLYQTELFFGSDNFFVKLANTGNVVVYSNDSVGNVAQWTFGATGNLMFPDNTVQTTAWTGTVTGANVTGTVANANLSQYIAVSDVNNNFSYHVVLSAGSGDKSVHIDADDNLQYNPAEGILTATRVDATYVLANLYYANGYLASNLVGSMSNIANGNSNINIATANGNVAISAVGNTTMTVTGTGANITGTANISGNITGSNATFTGNVTATNFIGNINITGNITGTSPNVSLVAGSYTMTFDNTGLLSLPTMGGDEGGEINFGIPASNTTLTTSVKVDVYQNKFRIFDGSTKGVYVDLSQAATGVGTLLNNRVSGFVNAGTFVTMDLIKATVTTTGSRGLSLATTTGTFSYNIGGNFGMSGAGSGGQSLASQTLTTTATSSIFGWGFAATGDTSIFILTDTTNSRCYRITLMIGPSFNNNAITIERLI